jgi:hypothetical protein
MVFTVKHKTFEQDVGKFGGGVLKCIEHKTKNFLITFETIFGYFSNFSVSKECQNLHKSTQRKLHKIVQGVLILSYSEFGA